MLGRTHDRHANLNFALQYGDDRFATTNRPSDKTDQLTKIDELLRI